jgi:RND family efflux transporter MFP subunit
MKKLLLPTIIILLSSCNTKEETTHPIVQNITESVYASGIVKSKSQYEVFSTVNGIIQKINVTEGDMVHKGDVLITLINETPKLNTENARLAATYSSVPYNLDQLNEFKERIHLARVKMQNDSTLFRRQQNLWAQDIGSRNELEQRELAWKNAVTTYQSALLQYKELRKQINFAAQQSLKNLAVSTSITNDYFIRANQDGKVYCMLKEPGEMVNTQTPIAVIGDANEFMMELQVDEYDIGEIMRGQKVFVGMDSYKGQVFEAIVTKIDPMMNDRSRSFIVEASFMSQPPKLYPNLTVEANILIRTKENALTIPRTYLVDESYVLLKNGEKRKVITGLKDYQHVEIISGLSKEALIQKPLQ